MKDKTINILLVTIFMITSFMMGSTMFFISNFRDFNKNIDFIKSQNNKLKEDMKATVDSKVKLFVSNENFENLNNEVKNIKTDLKKLEKTEEIKIGSIDIVKIQKSKTFETKLKPIVLKKQQYENEISILIKDIEKKDKKKWKNEKEKKELEKLIKTVNTKKEQYSKEVQKEFNEASKILDSKVKKVINNIMKKKKIKIVITKNNVFGASIDITEEVVKELNKK